MKEINAKRKALTVAAAAAAGIACFSIYNNSFLQKSAYLCESDRLPDEFDGFKIMHLSDFHHKRFGYKQNQLINETLKISPNIIVITGDIVHGSKEGTDYEKKALIVADYLRQAVKLAPIFYVPGNHEAETGAYPVIRKVIESCGVKVLENEAYRFERNGEELCIIGLLDPSFSGKRRNYDPLEESLEALSSANPEKFKIVLSHRPEIINIYARYEADLVFTGHAHGGQFRLPFIGGLYAPDQGVLPRYSEGCFIKGQTAMIVSRGLGNSGFPQRLFNRPEIVVTTLSSSGKARSNS